MAAQSPELAYAQTAAFFETQPYDVKNEIGQKIGQFATSFLSGEQVTFRLIDSWNPGQDDREYNFTPKDFADYLDSVDLDTKADIDFMAEKITAFSRFKPSIDALLTSDEKDAKSLSRGQQSSAEVYALKLDNKSYAVKVGHFSFGSTRQFRRGSSIGSIAYAVAFEPEKGIIVMDLVQGMPMTKLSFEERMAISDIQVKSAVDTVIEMAVNGLLLDAHPGNLLYDSKNGFGFIDYGLGETDESSPYQVTPAHQVMKWSNMFARFPAIQDAPERDSPEYQEWLIAKDVETIKLLDKYMNVLERDYPELLYEAVLKDERPLDGHYNQLAPGEYLDAFQSRLQKIGFTPLHRKPY